MIVSKKSVLVAALTLFVIWAVRSFERVLADQNGVILFCLGILFSVLVLLRHKDRLIQGRPPGALVPWLGGLGALMALAGIVLKIHQVEWLGTILLLYACLRWALPPRHGRDIVLALFLLYWANPLPGPLIGAAQLFMQRVSVLGSEWMLHALNARVWADGLFLRTGFHVFGVPEACSGMRTAATVMVCTLGVGVLMRLRWLETVALLVLSFAQVVALNVVRISVMVLVSPRMPPEWAQNFLHDTTGIFLLVTIVLTQIEATWWKSYSATRREKRVGIARGELDRPDKATVLPGVLRISLAWAWRVSIVLLLVAAVAFAGYKSRQSHRVAMLKGVVDGLMNSDPVTAERAIAAALRLAPGDRELLANRAQILVVRGKYDEALREFETLAPLAVEQSMAMSWALMAINRAEEAIRVVDALPAHARRLPGVAMIRAEYAARQRDPVSVDANLRLVGKSPIFAQRVRALFPFLAAHEQWDTIMAADVPVAYTDVVHALIALHANLRMRDISGAGKVMTQAVARWPDDVRFLGPLFDLAVARPGGGWEDALTENFVKNVGVLPAGAAAGHLTQAIELGRPDLAWMAYARLKALMPEDPALDLALAQFGEGWFRFRRRELGMQARDPLEVVDLRGLYGALGETAALGAVRSKFPEWNTLVSSGAGAERVRLLGRCLRSLARMEEAGELEERLAWMYPIALTMARRYDEAHVRWKNLAERFPARRPQALIEIAALFHIQGRWQEAYEAVSTHMEESPHFTPRAVLLQVDSLMNLGYGLYAMEVVHRAKPLFPQVAALDRAISAIWDVYGFKDEALFVLEQSGLELNTRTALQLLVDSGRLREASKRRTALPRGEDVNLSRARQTLLLPAAELSLVRRWQKPLAEDSWKVEESKARIKAEDAVSHFVRAIESLTAEWFAARGAGEIDDLGRWRDAGRNDLEKAELIKRLAMLQAQEDRIEKALASTEAALAYAPRSAMLHRVAIALTEGREAVVARARNACPRDPEIWLAWLVSQAAAGKGEAWFEARAKEASGNNRFSVETSLRAGDFLLRKGFLAGASLLAEDAVTRAMGLPAAYALATRCALLRKDMRQALSYALAGAENASDPGPFYRVIVDVKSVGRVVDADLVTALEYLRGQHPDDRQWSERLGHAYFERGDPRRAMTVFSEVLSGDMKEIRVQSILMAAESARLQGDLRRAVEILDAARAMYPEKMNILNNLVYYLAKDPRTLPRARDLLPGLLEKGGSEFSVLDTAATVLLRGGEIERSHAFMQRALSALRGDEYGLHESRLVAAEIDILRGDYESARAHLKAVRSAPDLSPASEAAVRELEARIRRHIEERSDKRGTR